MMQVKQSLNVRRHSRFLVTAGLGAAIIMAGSASASLPRRAAQPASLVSARYSGSLVYSFCTQPNCRNGEDPRSGLVADTGGALYGTANGGGGGCFNENSGCGTVFKLTRSESGYSESTIHTFQDGNDGAYPLGSMLVGKKGTLYGTTSGGGAGQAGTVFQLTPSHGKYVETILHSFNGEDGSSPVAGLIESKGVFYGTTLSGGPDNNGTVFKLTPSGSAYTETVVYSFGRSPDGAGPYGGVIMGGSGALYGTTLGGGASGNGIVFELTPSGSAYTESILHSFGPEPGPDCAIPYAGLIADRTGALYGTTFAGGGDNHGCVFKMTPSGSGFTESVIFGFTGVVGLDGSAPFAPLYLYGGTLFGTTRDGGVYGTGTVFDLTARFDGGYNESVVYSFPEDAQHVEGGPLGGVIDDGRALVGTSYAGGVTGNGSVFAVRP